MLLFLKRRRIGRLGAAAVVVLGLIGCGGKPSDADLAAALTRDDPLVGKVYEIRDIRRINGYERPPDAYVIEFSADIHILENPQNYFGRLSQSGQSGAGVVAAFGLATGGLAKWGLTTAALISASKKGDVLPVSGTTTMIKSERGWILRPE